MTKYLTEMLEEIAANSDMVAKYKDNTALKLLLTYAFYPENKFVLPEGVPPHKTDAAPLGMSPTNLIQEVRRLYIFTKAKDLYPARREQLFIQLLETVHPSEAALLLAVKDQTLLDLYPGLNVDKLIAEGLLLPFNPLPKPPAPVAKRGRGRPKKVR